MGRQLHEMPSPYDPLLARCELGYALEGIGPEALVLVAPPVER